MSLIGLVLISPSQIASVSASDRADSGIDKEVIVQLGIIILKSFIDIARRYDNGFCEIISCLKFKGIFRIVIQVGDINIIIVRSGSRTKPSSSNKQCRIKGKVNVSIRFHIVKLEHKCQLLRDCINFSSDAIPVASFLLFLTKSIKGRRILHVLKKLNPFEIKKSIQLCYLSYQVVCTCFKFVPLILFEPKNFGVICSFVKVPKTEIEVLYRV